MLSLCLHPYNITSSSGCQCCLYDSPANFPIKYKEGHYIATTGAKCGTKIGALTITFDDMKKFKDIQGQIKPLIKQSKNDFLCANLSRLNCETMINYSSFPDTPAVDLMTKKFKDVLNETVVGEAAVSIFGDTCWEQECNLGNLVTDSMVHCAYNNAEALALLRGQNREAISVWHGGAFFPDKVNTTGGIQ